MSVRLRIPQTVELVRCLKGTINAGSNKGKRVILRLWFGYASHGAKTGFSRVPHHWLEIILGEDRVGWSYSGRRLNKAVKDLAHNIRILNEIGVTLAESRGT